MHRKLAYRILAVIISTIMITLSLSPAFTKADGGVFDESWFKDWNDEENGLYNKEAGFGSIEIEQNPTTDKGTFDSTLVTNTKNFYSGAISLLNGSGLAAVGIEVVKTIKSEGFPSRELRSSSTNGLAKILLLSQYYITLKEEVDKVQDMAKELNRTSQDSRPAKVKELYEYIDDISGDFSFAKSNMEGTISTLNEVAGLVYDFAMARLAVDEDSDKGEHVPCMTLAFGGYDGVMIYNFPYIGSGNSYERYMKKITSVPRETFIACSTFIFKTYLDFLLEKRDEIRGYYNSASEDYWDTISSSESDGPGLIERNLSELVADVGYKIEQLLSMQTIRFENIIYGRVKTAGGIGLGINNFSFELEKKNMYGVTGSMIYAILRGLLVIGIMAFLMYYLAKESFVASARERSKIKDNIGFVLLAILLMYAMPNILDAFIHVRDAILSGIANSMQETAFNSMGTLTTSFREQAYATEGLLEAAEYMGMVIITVYLAFVYIGMACAMTIMFAFFPLFVIFSFKDHKILNEWFSFTLGIITTPLIDAVLFILPLIATQLKSSSDLIKLILCMSIIPARGMIRRILGFSSSTGAELVGLGAIMAGGRAIGAVARTAKNTVSNVSEGVSSIRTDRANARLHEGLANIESGGGSTGAISTSRSYAGRAGFGNVTASISEKLGSDATNGPLSGTVRDLREEERNAGVPAAVQNVFKNNANLDNFDSYGYAGMLDNETMAKMYRQRARRTALRTAFSTAGGIQGGLAGAGLGLGASTFLGTNAAMMMAGSGAAIGSQVGSGAGRLAGSAAMHAGNGAVAAANAIHAHNNTGVYPSVAGAATVESFGSPAVSLDVGAFAGKGRQPVLNDEGKPTYDMEGRKLYQTNPNSTNDIRYGIIGPDRLSTIKNIQDNDQLFATNIAANFSTITKQRISAPEMEEKLIDTYSKYGEIGASMLSDNREAALDKAYIPTGSKFATFNTMHDTLKLAVNARVNEKGRVIVYDGRSGGKKPAGYDQMPYAFPKIRHGYEAVSYRDDRGMEHKPEDGYIGFGMIENMANYEDSIPPVPRYDEGVTVGGEQFAPA